MPLLFEDQYASGIEVFRRSSSLKLVGIDVLATKKYEQHLGKECETKHAVYPPFSEAPTSPQKECRRS
jgi:hypothetical protein